VLAIDIKGTFYRQKCSYEGYVRHGSLCNKIKEAGAHVVGFIDDFTTSIKGVFFFSEKTIH